MPELVHLRRGAITELTLDNAPLNLVSTELTHQLRAALTEVARDAVVRVLVVTGAGDRAFCAGSDIHEFADLKGRVAEGKLLLEKLVYRQLANLPVPTIAAIGANALGGGLELALCCDLRIAAASARLGLPEVRLAVMPGSGGTQRLTRIVGPARAKELILTGRLLDAQRAVEIGLVNATVPDGQALSAAREWAAEIVERGPVAVREAKRVIDIAFDRDLDAGLAEELDASERIFASSDMEEGAAAFFAKRPPEFRGE
jgi:enoyl-CoA hydratase/carnithine racemase